MPRLGLISFWPKRVLTAALAAVGVSFLVLMLLIAGYAFVLAFEVRGAPDQRAINHFAGRISPRSLLHRGKLGPAWLAR